ncbi:MAG: hypothetical protein L0Z53_21700 [Acidobacteriales bacterium]|nr:hypothetical protein [Terriglobales bacterium]
MKNPRDLLGFEFRVLLSRFAGVSEVLAERESAAEIPSKARDLYPNLSDFEM